MPKVFVLLPDALDVNEWRQRWREGQAPDETPYGYHQAQAHGYEIAFSTPAAKRRGLAAVPFKIARRLLGFDIEHAWNNRRQAWAPDVSVVWTHTEHEFLPLLWLNALLRRRAAPVIGQIVWLADQWHRLTPLQRRRHRRLMRRAFLCTCHSPYNLGFLQDVVGERHARLVEFGIAAQLLAGEPPAAPRAPAPGQPLRLLSLGNDQHRDWPTLHAALQGLPGIEAFVGSANFPPALQTPFLQASALDMKALRERMAACHVVVVPLKHNLHASGLTVVLEAVACGKPVIASDTGGLRHYFSDTEVTYVPPGDPEALRQAVSTLFANEAALHARLLAARQKFLALELTSAGFVKRHIALSPSAGSR